MPPSSIDLTPYQSVLFFNVFVFSILLFAALLAFVHYLYTSDKSYLFYGGYLTSMFLYFLLDVVVLEYTLLFFPGWKAYVHLFAVPINILPFYLYLRFANEFVFFQKFNTAIFRKISLSAWFLLVYFCIDRILIHIVGRADLSLQVWFYVKLSFAFFILFLIFQAFQTDNRLARVFATGTLCFVLGGLIKAYHEKFIQAPHLTAQVWHSPFFFMQIGVLLEILFFNVGLIYRSRLLNQEYTDLQLQQQETEKIKELNEFKSRFYTNITHEFRTPMTVILGLCDQLAGQSREKMTESVMLIKRNGEQLLLLVNELLALSKAETRQLPTDGQTGDIIRYFRYLIESFRPLSQSKSVALSFHSAVPGLTLAYDAEKWKSILNNLLSNALKFSRENGTIRVDISIPATTVLQVQVSDSGVGIPSEDLPHIFKRYFQASNQPRHTPGTGIGLALAQEYVHSMGGQITAESQWGSGSVFTVKVPLPADSMSAQEAEWTVQLVESLPDETVSEQPVLLMVEDNADVAHYLRLCLQPYYTLLAAGNGQTGLAMARQHVPDLVISDVMMPHKDGYELCEQLKNDELLSHVPVILLTAKAAHEHRMEGLSKGADAYLTKPFDCQELVLLSEKLIESRRRLREKYRQEWETPTVATNDLQLHDAFLVRLREIIEDHLDDSAFGVEQLANAIHLSRSQLHRKLKAVTDLSAVHFIRQVRLAKARTLLQTTRLTIAEIAYAVGFDDPHYFTRVFTETEGTKPTQFRENRKAADA
jgi:signal transduction histidine kinase/DNA-binding response OmpR family regulator